MKYSQGKEQKDHRCFELGKKNLLTPLNTGFHHLSWMFVLVFFYISFFNEQNSNEQRVMSDGKEHKSKGLGSDTSLLGLISVDISQSLVCLVMQSRAQCIFPQPKTSALSNIPGLIGTVDLYYPEYLFP